MLTALVTPLSDVLQGGSWEAHPQLVTQDVPGAEWAHGDWQHTTWPPGRAHQLAHHPRASSATCSSQEQEALSSQGLRGRSPSKALMGPAPD